MLKGLMTRYVLITLAVVFASSTIWVKSRISRQSLKKTFGNLTISKLQPIDHSTRSHTFSIDSSRLSITDRAADQEILFIKFTEAFLNVGPDHYRAKETRGSFQFDFKNQRLCENQTLETVSANDQGISIGGTLNCQFLKRPLQWSLEFSIHSDGHMVSTIRTQPQMSRILFRFQNAIDEVHFGAGEQFTHLSLNGNTVPVWVSEQGIGRGLQPISFILDTLAFSGGTTFTTYLSSASFLTSRMRAFLWDTADYSELDLSEPDSTIIDSFSPVLSLQIFSEKTPKKLLGSLTRQTGRMRQLPDWIHQGAILGLQGGTKAVTDKLGKFENTSAKISALWLQDWVGQRKTSIGKQLWWNWTLDKNHYHDWENFRDSLASRGIRVLGYINPMLVKRPTDNGSLYFDEAKKNNYLVLNKDNNPLKVTITSFDASLIDLSNSKAREWLKTVIRKELVSSGFSGWMADFGEALPTSAKIQQGSAQTFHNLYADVWTELNREVIDEFPEKELVAFHRSGFTKSPSSSTLFWTGDQLVTWDNKDGLHSSLIGLISSGLSGFSLNHSDIGGYTSINQPVVRSMRTEELMLRWMELNAYTSIFRSHEGNLPDESLQVYSNKALIDGFAKWSDEFSRLFPYRKMLMKEAEETGVPIVRSMWLEFPNCKPCLALDSQFMFGDHYLVAPVLLPNKVTKNVYLPEGKWERLHLDDGAFESKGQWVTVDAPLGKPAVFKRLRDH